jgi:hypothetical protein
MKAKYVWGLVACVGVLLGAMPASAHHAASVAYDLKNVVAVQGVVTEVKWENPHTWVYLDVKDASGKVVKWSFEGAVPNQLYRRGVTPAVLKPGLTLTIKAHPARDTSRTVGELMEVVTADGRTIRVGTGGAP